MKELKSTNLKVASIGSYITRIGIIIVTFMMFFPGLNPARLLVGTCGINKNLSLFTSGIAYKSLISDSETIINRGNLPVSIFVMIFISCMIVLIGIGLAIAGGCLSLGNIKCKKLGSIFTFSGSIAQLLGMIGVLISYFRIQNEANLEGYAKAKIAINMPMGYTLFAVVILISFLASVLVFFSLLKEEAEENYEMETKFKLFLMYLPFIALIFVFSYLPLWGWRYAFYKYSPGDTLSSDNFVGLYWFKMLFQNAATRRDIIRVLRNTLAMSGLGIATSWIAMAFAVFLSEIKCGWFRRFVQIFTTIPNFISWVLVYAIALAIFSSDGFVNSFLGLFGIAGASEGYLMGNSNSWLKMLGWGMWKGVGWSAIIYIAAISGIDQQLYEAATVDGAGRFQKMRHITLPGLIPTYCVLLLMAIAGILSNGMDQYLVFKNAQNESSLEVLDLYVYTLGIQNGANGTIPLSTVIGMTKSVVSVILLFVANGISKLIRGESIF